MSSAGIVCHGAEPRGSGGGEAAAPKTGRNGRPILHVRIPGEPKGPVCSEAQGEGGRRWT